VPYIQDLFPYTTKVQNLQQARLAKRGYYQTKMASAGISKKQCIGEYFLEYPKMLDNRY
jgi:hypothetical protein